MQVGSGGVAVTARTSDVLGKICLAAVGRDGEHGWTHPITVDRVAQGLAQFLASSSFCCTAAADVSFLSTCPRAAVPLPTHIPPPPIHAAAHPRPALPHACGCVLRHIDAHAPPPSLDVRSCTCAWRCVQVVCWEAAAGRAARRSLVATEDAKQNLERLARINEYLIAKGQYEWKEVRVCGCAYQITTRAPPPLLSSGSRSPHTWTPPPPHTQPLPTPRPRLTGSTRPVDPPAPLHSSIHCMWGAGAGGTHLSPLQVAPVDAKTSARQNKNVKGSKGPAPPPPRDDLTQDATPITFVAPTARRGKARVSVVQTARVAIAARPSADPSASPPPRLQAPPPPPPPNPKAPAAGKGVSAAARRAETPQVRPCARILWHILHPLPPPPPHATPRHPHQRANGQPGHPCPHQVTTLIQNPPPTPTPRCASRQLRS